MTYAEADLLSSRDKEFIRDLFPLGEIHTSLFDDRARDVIGRVGAQTLGVERMLVAAGFRYARRVDPFDGGPHFVARTDDVALIQNARRVRFRGVIPATDDPAAGAVAARAVVLQYLPRAPYVVSVQSDYRWVEPDGVLLPGVIAEHLALSVSQNAEVSQNADAELMVTPLPPAAARPAAT